MGYPMSGTVQFCYVSRPKYEPMRTQNELGIEGAQG